MSAQAEIAEPDRLVLPASSRGPAPVMGMVPPRKSPVVPVLALLPWLVVPSWLCHSMDVFLDTASCMSFCFRRFLVVRKPLSVLSEVRETSERHGEVR